MPFGIHPEEIDEYKVPFGFPIDKKEFENNKNLRENIESEYGKDGDLRLNPYIVFIKKKLIDLVIGNGFPDLKTYFPMAKERLDKITRKEITELKKYINQEAATEYGVILQSIDKYRRKFK